MWGGERDGLERGGPGGGAYDTDGDDFSTDYEAEEHMTRFVYGHGE